MIETAKAIASGETASPVNLSGSWLVSLRITGTGTTTRGNTQTYRNPDDYLTDDFLERCNGLPVIIGHPDDALLDSGEYSERSIGSIIYPYIQGDEVWGVARLFIDEIPENISTSPCVISQNDTITDDGIIEGSPDFIDHVALCDDGVWDKGDSNNKGFNVVNPTTAGNQMTEDEAAAAAAKPDEAPPTPEAPAAPVAAAAPTPDAGMGALLEIVTALAEKVALLSSAPKADESGKLEGIEAALATKADALPEDEIEKRDDVQVKADSILGALGKRLKIPGAGEKARAYQLRILNDLKATSKAFANSDLSNMPDDALYGAIAPMIYADAMAAYEAEAQAVGGAVRKVVKQDGGRTVVSYEGNSTGGLIASQALNTRFVERFNFAGNR